jgi:hypothetical protein
MILAGCLSGHLPNRSFQDDKKEEPGSISQLALTTCQIVSS